LLSLEQGYRASEPTATHAIVRFTMMLLLQYRGNVNAFVRQRTQKNTDTPVRYYLAARAPTIVVNRGTYAASISYVGAKMKVTVYNIARIRTGQIALR
jgi:hypothetical protein